MLNQLTQKTELPPILLVDDEAAIRSLFSIALKSQGYTVITAVDGHEAVELCRSLKTQISLLLTDLTMPRKNGIELARELKTMWPDLPVIFMSGNRFNWESTLGDVACMQKPFSPTDLFVEVTKVLAAPATRPGQVEP